MSDDLPERVARRYRQANDQAALEAMAGYWADVFLDQFVGAVDLIRCCDKWGCANGRELLISPTSWERVLST